MAKDNFADWSKDDLIKEIKKLKKRKKYGIVWEEKTEQVVELCKDKLPVLIEDKERNIFSAKERPVNVLVEGDNYHALSVLNYTHRGKIDVIYIDPPYNTGIEGFTFNDKIVDREDTYRHSKWLSFMEKRLKLAKTLLRESGTIFISIDDNEAAQIKLLCDEIFGETNLVANIIWKRRANPPNDQIIGTTHEYILCYAKNSKSAKLYRRERTQENIDRYKNPDGHPKGPWVAGDLMANVKGGRYVKSLRFPIKSPVTGEEFYPSSNGNWRFNREKIELLMKNNEIYFGKDGKGRPKLKRFLADVREGVPLASIWDDVGFNTTATGELMRLFGTVNIFDTPKPLPLITEILKLTTAPAGKELILDFFAGSGTTGEAVLELNDADKGKRKFILCTDNQNNICTEVCYPRLRKVITGYQNPNNESIQGVQGNLKYFKTDFVDAEPTDLNKKMLVDKSTEMLCLKEDCFNEIKNEQHFKMFDNEDGKSLGIIYDDDGIEPFKQEVRKSNKKFIVYVFSLDESAREEEFYDIQDSVNLKPIPAVILNVYKRIFK
jgi:adenine-specific DNA-methyltransferase